MLLAVVALLLQGSPVQPLDHPAASAEQPAAAVISVAAEPLPVAPRLPEAALPLPDLTARPAMALLLSAPSDAPEGSASALPAHPDPVRVAPSSGTGAPLIAVQPRLRPGAAGLISVVGLRAEVRRRERVWLALAAVEHGAAAFDAWSTRRSLANGGQERNPLMKPFANSSAIYAATQAGPLLFDYLGKRMMFSHNPMLRRVWWLPQVASTATSLFCGVHNLGVQRPAQP